MQIKKIFVAALGRKGTGGVESLHQFASACTILGYDVYIYYFDVKRETIFENLRNYNIKVATAIEDIADNLLIWPETYTSVLRKYKYIRKCIWFLSLDFYLRSLPFFRTKYVLNKWNIPKIFYPAVFWAVLMKTEASLFSIRLGKDKIDYFLYNCEYAREYIEGKVPYNHVVKYMCGPLNEIYFQENIKRDILNQKEELVVYNPRKANKFTEKIIDRLKVCAPNIQCVAIQNMSQKEVKDLLLRTKVYIDFGYFPGPERIPREAAMMWCNIITSNLGSAANDIDVPINKSYKFELIDENIDDIVDLILDMVYHSNNYTDEYDRYREKVIQQKLQFEDNVADFLESVENCNG